MPTLFSKIISGEIPAYKVAETNDYLAFLDVRPLALGHTLVIPKRETDYIFDLDDEAFVGLHLFSKLVAQGLKKAIDCKRVGVAVIGLEVPHAHIHLVPLQHIGDLNFENERQNFTPEKYMETATAIRNALEGRSSDIR